MSDNIHFQGVFWIISDSLSDITSGNFEILGEPENITQNPLSAFRTLHKQLWGKYCTEDKYVGKDYKYYPRGRVIIAGNNAYISLNEVCNTPEVIDAITKKYNISDMKIVIEFNDVFDNNTTNREKKEKHFTYQLK